MKKKQPSKLDRVLLLVCLAMCVGLTIHAVVMHLHAMQFEADTVQVVRQLIEAFSHLMGSQQ